MTTENAVGEGVRLGIVGFGRMAESYHLPALRLAGWSVDAVMDVTPARRAAATAQHVPFVCETIDAFIASGVQAALVAPNSSVRLSVVRPLAAAGIHMLIEKPLATTAVEAKQICQACEKSGVLCSVFHNRRWDADFLRVKRLIDEEFIGRPLRVENRLFESEPSSKFGAPDFNQAWRVTASLGGGSMLDWGPHLLDQALALMAFAGPVVSVHADVRHVRHGDADDHFMIDLRFDNGARALVGKSDICPIGPKHKWLVIADAGSLIGDWDSATARNVDGDERTIDEKVVPANLHRNFLEAVRDGKPLLVTARQSLRTVEVFDAARQSAAKGESVRVRI